MEYPTLELQKEGSIEGQYKCMHPNFPKLCG